MTSSQQVLVLRAVVRLDHSLTKVLGHVDAVAASASPSEASTSKVLRGVRAQLSPVLSALREVREMVLTPVDENAIECVEATLRARAAVVMLQLIELCDAEAELPAGTAAIASRFGSATDLSGYLAERIRQVHAIWQTERRQLLDTSTEHNGYDALYHVVLDNAEHGFVAIGREPDVERFLRQGATIESPRFRSACRTIAAALDLTLGSDAPRSGWSAPRALGGLARREQVPPATPPQEPVDG